MAGLQEALQHSGACWGVGEMFPSMLWDSVDIQTDVGVYPVRGVCCGEKLQEHSGGFVSRPPSQVPDGV